MFTFDELYNSMLDQNLPTNGKFTKNVNLDIISVHLGQLKLRKIIHKWKVYEKCKSGYNINSFMSTEVKENNYILIVNIYKECKESNNFFFSFDVDLIFK